MISVRLLSLVSIYSLLQRSYGAAWKVPSDKSSMPAAAYQVEHHRPAPAAPYPVDQPQETMSNLGESAPQKYGSHILLPPRGVSAGRKAYLRWKETAVFRREEALRSVIRKGFEAYTTAVWLKHLQFPYPATDSMAVKKVYKMAGNALLETLLKHPAWGALANTNTEAGVVNKGSEVPAALKKALKEPLDKIKENVEAAATQRYNDKAAKYNKSAEYDYDKSKELYDESAKDFFIHCKALVDAIVVNSTFTWRSAVERNAIHQKDCVGAWLAMSFDLPDGWRRMV